MGWDESLPVTFRYRVVDFVQGEDGEDFQERGGGRFLTDQLRHATPELF